MRSTFLIGFLLAGASVAHILPYCDEANPPACCTNVPKRRAARNLFARTGEEEEDTCPAGSFGDPCCPGSTSGPPEVSNGKIDLQCGANFGDDPQDVDDGVTFIVKTCTLPQTGLCLVISSTPVGTITDTHLHLSGSPLTGSNVPPNGLGNWNSNGYCTKLTGVCEVPLSAIMTLLATSNLCTAKLYAAYHISLSSGPTCFARGDRIGDPNAKPARWFMYVKISFTCPSGCGEKCCCKNPVEPPTDKYCADGTAFGYNTVCPRSGTDPPDEPTCPYYLQDRDCKRWGWYHKIDSLPYTSDLYVGAGHNNVETKGHKVGTAEVELCDGGANYCVTYTMDSGYHINAAHVEIQCSEIVKKEGGKDGTQGYPCAPGSYNIQSTCPIESGETWIGKTEACDPETPLWAIFHGAVTKKVSPGDPLYATCSNVDCSFQDPDPGAP